MITDFFSRLGILIWRCSSTWRYTSFCQTVMWIGRQYQVIWHRSSIFFGVMCNVINIFIKIVNLCEVAKADGLSDIYYIYKSNNWLIIKLNKNICLFSDFEKSCNLKDPLHRFRFGFLLWIESWQQTTTTNLYR